MFDMMHTPTSRTTGATTNAVGATTNAVGATTNATGTTGTTAHATGRAPTGTNHRRTPLRKATLATAAALTLTFGAAGPLAHAAPAAPASECVHEHDPTRLEGAIAQSKWEGHISDGPTWAPNKSLEFLGGDCGEAIAQPISARGGDPTAPTALLLYHPHSGEYVMTAEIPGFAAEGPAWGKNTSGMTSISRIAPDTIRVEWANGAGGKATVDYLFVDGTYQLMLRDATGHND